MTNMGNSTSIILGSVAAVATIASGAGFLLWFFLRKQGPPRTLKGQSQKISLCVVDRQFITHDTMMLKLGLDSPEHILGLPVGNHIYISARINGELVVRPYTPVSLDSQKGYVDFVIKVYKANINPNFPMGGKMSQYLMNIPISQYVDIRGPAGNLHYKGFGVFQIKEKSSSAPKQLTVKFVNMICGGSGITPMYQLLRYILSQKKDDTKVALLFANNSEKDIILRDELDILETNHRDQMRLWFTLTDAPEDWRYSTGYVSEQMLAEHIYPPGDDTLVLLCGPAAMIEHACHPSLAKLDYPRDRIFTF